MNRILWIDICKALGIFLVVLGHTLRNDISYIYIYGFHMPLFFFLSGLVFDEKKYNLGTLVKSRFNSLIIPYIFFYLLTYVYWVVIEHNFRTIDLEWWQPLLGLIYAAQWHGLMEHNGILWFLPCLFTVEILYYFISKLKLIYCLPIIILLSIWGFNLKDNLPWGINIAIVAIQFFFVGNKLKEPLSNYKNLRIEIPMVLVFLIIYVVGQMQIHNKVSMAFADYGNLIAFEIFAFLGISIIVLSSKPLTFKASWGGVFLGKNTLIIFALHQPIIRIFRFLGGYLFGNFPIDTNLGLAIIVDIAVILLLYPFIVFYNSKNKTSLV